MGLFRLLGVAVVAGGAAGIYLNGFVKEKLGKLTGKNGGNGNIPVQFETLPDGHEVVKAIVYTRPKQLTQGSK